MINKKNQLRIEREEKRKELRLTRKIMYSKFLMILK